MQAYNYDLITWNWEMKNRLEKFYLPPFTLINRQKWASIRSFTNEFNNEFSLLLHSQSEQTLTHTPSRELWVCVFCWWVIINSAGVRVLFIYKEGKRATNTECKEKKQTWPLVMVTRLMIWNRFSSCYVLFNISFSGIFWFDCTELCVELFTVSAAVRTFANMHPFGVLLCKIKMCAGNDGRVFAAYSTPVKMYQCLGKSHQKQSIVTTL